MTASTRSKRVPDTASPDTPVSTAETQAKPESSPSMIKGASLLIILQLLSRLITFVANQLLLRFLTAPLLAISTQLEVYYLSVLFFARESLRVAIQRQGTRAAAVSDAKEKQDARDVARAESQAVINLGYLAIILGLFFSIGLGWMYLAYASDSMLATSYLIPSLRLYGVAAMIELLSEPCFVLMQTRLQFGTRATAESIATFIRCSVLFSSAVWAYQRQLDIGVLPFALGQLAYGTSLLFVYLLSGYHLASTSGFSLFPKALSPDMASQFFVSYFYKPTISLAGSMMAQSVVKHLLTQGDTFLISLLASPQTQGVYALANNYGGLLARLLFQPVEESSRSYFSRLLSSSEDRTISRKIVSKPSPAVEEARQSLSTLVRFYILLSAAAVTFGPFAAPPLLAIVAGKDWIGSGAGRVLGVYCFYIPFLALNGLTESFVASVASEAEVHIQSGWMSAFSVAFAAAAFLFMRVFPLGANGLVFANIINMFCRIIWSTVFIRQFFNRYGANFPLRKLLPGGTVAASLAVIAVMYQIYDVQEAENQPIKALAKIAVTVVPWIGSIIVIEQRFLLECFHSIRGRKEVKQTKN